MAGSIERVTEAAKAAGLEIEIKRMGASTRTAEEAAEQCGCAVDQIVKSLVFQGNASGGLYLFLLAGSSRLDLAKAAPWPAKHCSAPIRGRSATGPDLPSVAFRRSATWRRSPPSPTKGSCGTHGSGRLPGRMTRCSPLSRGRLPRRQMPAFATFRHSHKFHNISYATLTWITRLSDCRCSAALFTWQDEADPACPRRTLGGSPCVALTLANRKR